jgi:hypothetical protein
MVLVISWCIWVLTVWSEVHFIMPYARRSSIMCLYMIPSGTILVCGVTVSLICTVPWFLDVLNCSLCNVICLLLCGEELGLYSVYTTCRWPRNRVETWVRIKKSLLTLDRYYYCYYYLNCKWVFTRWQWYYNKTQHTNNTPHSNKTPCVQGILRIIYLALLCR